MRLKKGELTDSVAEKVAHLAALQYQADPTPGGEEESKEDVSL